MNIYQNITQIRKVVDDLPYIKGDHSPIFYEERAWKAIAKASANHAVKEAYRLLKGNNCGSVHIPNSGQHGYDTSHIKIKFTTWDEFEKFVEEIDNE